jgi:formylglycine-generating enzyme required for sulfatase activity
MFFICARRIYEKIVTTNRAWCMPTLKSSPEISKKSPILRQQCETWVKGAGTIVRGGSFNDEAFACRSANHAWLGRDGISRYFGLRLCLPGSAAAALTAE